MHQKTKNIQKRYEGFLQTPALWKDHTFFEMSQFEMPTKLVKLAIVIDEKLRLGRYIERFVSFQLSQSPEFKIISENVQIQKDKITLGELDCLLTQHGQPIHLEICYKFYLYDERAGNNEIAHFIGPNRKDSLFEKLTKLQQKQLPLLYSEACAHYLKSLALTSKEMKQYVCFKAQLFVPFSNKNLRLKEINQDCIAGFYANVKDLEQLSKSKFFIPVKKDWLLSPNKNVNWQSIDQFISATKESLENQFSPLCWLKKPNGEIEKFFLVWWD
jgi:hypothetical protein